jgi:hypothetical protein
VGGPKGLAQIIRAHLDQHRLLTTVLEVKAPTYVGVQVRARIKVASRRRAEEVCALVERALRAFLAPVNVLPPKEPDPQDADAHMRWSNVTAMRPMQNSHAHLNGHSDASHSEAQFLAAVQGFLAALSNNADHNSSGTNPGGEADWNGWPFGRALTLTEINALMLSVPGVTDVDELGLFVVRFSPDQETPSKPSELLAYPKFKLELAPHELICSFDTPALAHEVRESAS